MRDYGEGKEVVANRGALSARCAGWPDRIRHSWESLTFDEGNHMFAGFMMLHRGDYGLHLEHPPMVYSGRSTEPGCSALAVLI